MSQNGGVKGWPKWVGLAGLLLVTLVLLTIVAAPSSNPRISGSTYLRSPDGYAAWYAYMAERGTPIQRWERPFADLGAGGVTLVRVQSGFLGNTLAQDEANWVAAGNRLVNLGTRSPVTPAYFTSRLPSESGTVRIDTRRRQSHLKNGIALLEDGDGAIVWRQSVGDGEVVRAVTPYLGANAYQNEAGNFEFLAQIVVEGNQTIWIDEYIHGYRDQEAIAPEVAGSWSDYLARTPLMPLLIQLLLVLLIFIWAKNQRTGVVRPLEKPQVNNSQAYIEALAAVLQKAGRSGFVVQMVGQAAQRQMQRRLGLGGDRVEAAVLLDAWVEHTGRPAQELAQVMRPYWQKQALGDRALHLWLNQLRTIQQQLGP
ncbi:MAG: DUF4350 domain-containing protein [Synechococcales bacterium]|nr:DUF4350 domain-containing protein [Synechococcales bacterium]